MEIAREHDPAKADGHGSINSQGDRVTFQFRAGQSDDSTSADYFLFCHPAAGVCLTKAGIRTLSFNRNPAEFSGTAQLDDGAEVHYTVSVTDNRKPGTQDTISIDLSDGYSVGGALITGDIRIY